MCPVVQRVSIKSNICQSSEFACMLLTVIVISCLFVILMLFSYSFVLQSLLSCHETSHFQVAKRTTGIAPDQLVEPLRELCMSCASAKEVKDKDLKPGEVNSLELEMSLGGFGKLRFCADLNYLVFDMPGERSDAQIDTTLEGWGGCCRLEDKLFFFG